MVTEDMMALAHDVDARCRLTGEFTLRSGIVSEVYFDKYQFEADPLLLRRVAEGMVALLPPDTEVLGGLELGGVPIATVMSALTGLPLGLVRKEAKTYGTCRLVEGADVAGRHVVLIEDVITTGGAARAAAVELRRREAQVDTVVCAIDRFEGETHPLAEVGVSVRSLLTRQLLGSAR